jgi:micrococcal nuclease
MRPRNVIPWLVFLAAFAALVAGRKGDSSSASSLSGRVVRVVDGDTIKVSLGGGRTERVRYIGVDTPESVKPGTPVQCFAKRASHFNASLVGGREVTLRTDAEARDRYGRLLAYVYTSRPPHVFVNRELVAKGYARTLTIPPNVAHAGEFASLARQARERGRGLWSACG